MGCEPAVGVLLMFVGAVGSVAAGALRWSWLMIVLGAGLWTIGYFLHKPHVLSRPDGGSPVALVAMIVAVTALVCAGLFGAGRLMAG